MQISGVLRRKLLRAPENMTIGGAPDCSSSHGRLFIGGKRSLARPPDGTAIATVVSRDQILADAAHRVQGRTVLLNIGKCLTFRLLFHRGRFHGSPGTDVSAILSTGCHRGTRGEVVCWACSAAWR